MSAPKARFASACWRLPRITSFPPATPRLRGAKLLIGAEDFPVLNLIEHIGLASDPNFQDRFVDCMAFPDAEVIASRKARRGMHGGGRVTMRLLLIGCGLLVRELSDAIVHSPHLVDAKFLPAGLHDTGAKSMRQRLQQEIDSVDTADYDASCWAMLCAAWASRDSRRRPFRWSSPAPTTASRC